MARRSVFKIAEITRMRAGSWAWSYKLWSFAKNSGIDPLKVLNALVAVGMPEPEMQIDGSLYRPLDVIKAEAAALDKLGYGFVSVEMRSSMCVWYWTEANWMSFVRQYEALPDPIPEDYYLLYDAERDGGRLVPMSSKPKRGDVPSPVDKSLSNSSTSQVQVPRFTYK